MQPSLGRFHAAGRPRRFATVPLKPVAAAVAAALIAGYGPGLRSAYAGPTGEALVGGSATVQRPNAQTTIVNQTSHRAAIDWNGFSIGASEAVHFRQPSASSIALNRVVLANPSVIAGTLQATGQVFLVNPSGILFAKGASVDVAGLVASTLSIAPNDFMNGRYAFSGDGGKLTVEKGVTLRAGDRGYVALLANQVSNSGTLTASNGTVALGAGRDMVLDFHGDGLLSLKVNAAAAGAKIAHDGIIVADGGRVIMSAQARNALLDTVLNVDGIVQARGAVERNGSIYLDGGDSGVTRVAGVLDVSSAHGRGGEARVLGDFVGLFGKANIDASGRTGGGTVLVGGDYQGRNGDVRNAFRSLVDRNAVINADATVNGDGGQVIVWADNATRFDGAISAKGGAQGGNGGFVEVSGKRHLSFNGKANLSAPNGKTGTLLLDPETLIIDGGGPDAGGPSTVSFADAPATITVTEATLEALDADIVLEATKLIRTGATAFDGNQLTIAPNRNLTLRTRNRSALGDTGGTHGIDLTNGGTNAPGIVLQGSGSFSATSGFGDGTNNGDIAAPVDPGSIITNGGSVTVSSNSTLTLTGTIRTTPASGAGGNVFLTAGDAITIASGASIIAAGATSISGEAADVAGSGGEVLIRHTNALANRAITLNGAVDASGGQASDAVDTAGSGGIVTVVNESGNIVLNGNILTPDGAIQQIGGIGGSGGAIQLRTAGDGNTITQAATGSRLQTTQGIVTPVNGQLLVDSTGSVLLEGDGTNYVRMVAALVRDAGASFSYRDQFGLTVTDVAAAGSQVGTAGLTNLSGITTNGGAVDVRSNTTLTIAAPIITTPTAGSVPDGGAVTLTAVGAIASTAAGTITTTGAAGAAGAPGTDEGESTSATEGGPGGAGGAGGAVVVRSTGNGAITLNGAVTARGAAGGPGGTGGAMVLGTDEDGNRIFGNAAPGATGAAGAGGSVTVRVDGSGTISLGAAIDSTGGAATDIAAAGAGGAITLQGPVVLTANPVTLTSAGGAASADEASVDGPGGAIRFTSTLDGQTAFLNGGTVDAGTGNVIFEGVTGGSVPLGALTVVKATNIGGDAAAATAAPAITAQSVDFTALGNVRLGDITTTRGSFAPGNVQITAAAGIEVTGKINTAAPRAAVAAPGGSVTLATFGPMGLGEIDTSGNSADSIPGGSAAGDIDFGSPASITLRGNITARGGDGNSGSGTAGNGANLTFGAPVVLAGDVTIDTRAGGDAANPGTDGNVTFATTVNSLAAGSARPLTVNTAGTTTFGGPVGAATPLASLTTDAGGTTAFNGGPAPSAGAVTSVTTTGAQTYNDAITLGANTTLTSTGGGAVTFVSTIQSAPDADTAQTILATLAVNTSGTTTFNADISVPGAELGGLATGGGGTTRFAGAGTRTILTHGPQTYGDAVELAANTLFSLCGCATLPQNITFGSTINADVAANNRTLDIRSDNGIATFSGSIGNTRKLAAFEVYAPSIVFDAPSLQVVQVAGGGSGPITLTGAFPGTAPTAIRLAQAVSFTSSGTISFNGTIDGTNTGGVITGALATDAPGSTAFGGAVGASTPLRELSTAGGPTFLAGGAVNTVDQQSYRNPVQLLADTTLTNSGRAGPFGAGAILLDGTVDSTGGPFSLAVNAGGGSLIRFAGDVGAAGPLSTLQATLTGVDSAGVAGHIRIVSLPGSSTTITTTGAQSYTGALNLFTDTTLVSSGGAAIGLNGTLNSPSAVPAALTIDNGSGAVTFGGAVGGAGGFSPTPAPLGSITQVGNGPVAVNGGLMSTTGAQVYNGTVTAGGAAGSAVGFSGSSLDFHGTTDALVAGNHPLTLTADALTFGGNVSGTSTLLVQPTADNVSVGIAGAAGTLALSQAGHLDRLQDGFSAIVIGRATGGATTTVSAVGFKDPVTIRQPAGAGRVVVDGTLMADESVTLVAGSGGVGLNANVRTTGVDTTAAPGTSASSGAITIVAGGDVIGAGSLSTGDASADGAGAPTNATSGSISVTSTTGNVRAGAFATGRALMLNADGGDTASAGSIGISAAGIGTSAARQSVAIGSATGGDANTAGLFTATTHGTGAAGDLFVTIASSLSAGALTATGADARIDVNRTGSSVLTLTGNITTAGGAIVLDAPVILANDVTVGAGSGDITFGGVLDGPFGLAANSTNATTFAGAVGETTPLAALTTDAGGTTVINGGLVRTTGAQAYNDAVSGAHVTLASTADGGHITAAHAANDFTGVLTLSATGNSNVTIADANGLTLGAVVIGGNFTATAAGSIATSGGVNTANTIAVAGDTSLTAGGIDSDITISNDITRIASTPATLVLRAARDVIFDNGAGITAGGTGGALAVTLNADRDQASDPGGSIRLGSGTVITSNGGAITLGGGVDPASTPARGTPGNTTGISLGNARLSSGAGPISLRGTGFSGSPGGMGIVLDGGSTVESTTAAVSLAGTGGGGTNFNVGVYVNGAGTTVRSNDGDIAIVGTGAGSESFNYGTWIADGATVSSTGSARIDVSGTGGAGTGFNYGVYVTGAGTTVRSNDGSIAIVGTGAGSESFNYGTWISDGAAVSSTGSARIDVRGTGGAGAMFNYGVYVNGAGSTVRSNGGDITLVGTGAGSDLSNYGTSIANGATVSSAGNAKIDVRGTGGAGTRFNYGVYVFGAGTTVSSNGGDITLVGTGAGSESFNYGTWISEGATVSSTGNAKIDVRGTGGAGADANYGVLVSSAATRITAATGDISITGRSTGGSVGINHDSGARVGDAAMAGNILLHSLSATGMALLAGNIETTGSVTLSASGGGTVSQSGGHIKAAGLRLLNDTPGTFDLNASANSVATLAGAVTGVLSYTNATALDIGSVTSAAVAGGAATTTSGLSITGAGVVSIRSVGLTQSAAVAQGAGAGQATFNAGAGPIALTHAANDFAGPLNLSNSGANDVAVTDASALVLGTVSVGRNFTVHAGGAVTQTGPAFVPGTASFAAGPNPITLANPANDFAGVVNASGTSVSLTDANALTAGAITATGDLSAAAGTVLTLPAVTTGGRQTYSGTSIVLSGDLATTDSAVVFNGPVVLAASISLNAGTGNAVFADALDSAAGTMHGLTVNSTGTTRFGGAVGGAHRLSALTTNAGGTTELGGALTTSGAQTYNDNVTLTGDTTLTGTTPTFGGTVSGAGNDLTLNFSGTTTIGGATFTGIRNLASGNGGATNISGALTTTGSQTYGDNVTLAGATTLTGTTPTFGGTVSGAGNDLTLNFSGTTAIDGATFTGIRNLATGNGGTTNVTGALTTTGTQTYNDNVTLAGATTLTGTTPTFGGNVAGAGFDLALNFSGTTTIDGATFTGIRNLATGNGGTTNLSGALTTTGTQTYNDNVTLAGATTLTGTTPTFGGTVSGAGNDLTLNFSGTTAIDGATFTGIRNLATGNGGTTNLTGALTTTGTQTYNDNVTLAGATTLTGTTPTFGGNVVGASFDLTLNFSGTTTIDGATFTGIRDLATGNGGGTNLTGAITTTGTQTYNDNVTLIGATTLTGTTPTVSGNVAGGGNDLTLNFSGTTVIDGARYTGIRHLASGNGGTTNLTGAITTTGTQSYNDDVSLLANTALTGTIPTFGGNVAGGGNDLTLNFSGTTAIDGARFTGIRDLTTGNGGITSLRGALVTTGAQTFGDNVALAANTTLTGTTPTFGGTVDGAGFDLTLDFSGTTRIDGATFTGIRDLASGNGGATNLTGAITTTGRQSYNDDVTLLSNTTLTGTTPTFGGTVTGSGNDLALDFSGSTTIDGARVTGIRNLSTGNGGTTNLSGAITTTGTQTYNDNVALLANTTLTGTTPTFGGNLNGGGFDATLNFSGTTAISGAGFSGVRDLTIGNGGITSLAGALTTTGTQTYNDSVQLAGDTVLNSGAGSVTFAGSLESPATPRALTITSGNVVQFTGAVGNNTNPLASLATTAARTDINGGAVTTSGTQTYNNPVVIGANTTLTSSAGNVTFGGALDADSFAAARTLLVTAPVGTVTFSGSIGANAAFADLDVVSGPNTIVFNGSSPQTVNVNAGSGGNTVSFAGSVLLGQNVSIDTGGAANNNVMFVNGIETGGATNRTFSINAGSGNIDLQAIGNATPLAMLTANGGVVSFNQNAVAQRIVIGANQALTNGTATLISPLAFAGFDGPAALTLNGPPSGGIYGGEANMLRVDVPGLLLVRPDTSRVLFSPVWLQGDAAKKPFYQWYDDTSRREVVYNGRPVATNNGITDPQQTREILRQANDDVAAETSLASADAAAGAAREPLVCTAVDAKGAAALACAPAEQR